MLFNFFKRTNLSSKDLKKIKEILLSLDSQIQEKQAWAPDNCWYIVKSRAKLMLKEIHNNANEQDNGNSVYIRWILNHCKEYDKRIDWESNENKSYEISFRIERFSEILFFLQKANKEILDVLEKYTINSTTKISLNPDVTIDDFNYWTKSAKSSLIGSFLYSKILGFSDKDIEALLYNNMNLYEIVSEGSLKIYLDMFNFDKYGTSKPHEKRKKKTTREEFNNGAAFFLKGLTNIESIKQDKTKKTSKQEDSSNLNDNRNKINTSSAQVLFQKGQSARYGKDYKLAIQYYEDAIKIDPNHAGSYFYLGLIYDEVLQKYDLSLEYYSKVIKVDPEPDPVTYYNRGIVYAKLKKYKDAINDFTIAIEKDPTNASAFKNRGVVKQHAGLNSCSDWKKACELGSTECCSWFERDGCYGELKEKETSKQESSSHLNKLKQKNIKSSSNFMFELDELQALFYMMTQIGLIDGEFSEKEQAFSNSIIEEMPGFNLVSDWKSFVDDAFALKGEDALNILKKIEFQKRIYVMKVLVSLIGSDGKFDDKEISALNELKVVLDVNDSDLKFNRNTDYLDDKILDLLDQALKYSSKK